jgi:hypothetical protein
LFVYSCTVAQKRVEGTDANTLMGVAYRISKRSGEIKQRVLGGPVRVGAAAAAAARGHGRDRAGGLREDTPIVPPGPFPSPPLRPDPTTGVVFEYKRLKKKKEGVIKVQREQGRRTEKE